MKLPSFAQMIRAIITRHQEPGFCERFGGSFGVAFEASSGHHVARNLPVALRISLVQLFYYEEKGPTVARV